MARSSLFRLVRACSGSFRFYKQRHICTLTKSLIMPGLLIPGNCSIFLQEIKKCLNLNALVFKVETASSVLLHHSGCKCWQGGGVSWKPMFCVAFAAKLTLKCFYNPLTSKLPTI